MSDEILYDRDPRYIPRVAAVHDMCGYGKCSLTAAIPILSAAGCDVCPVPTALFSAHTRYEVFTFHDTTEILDGYLDAWRQENVDLDGVYSGFLGFRGPGRNHQTPIRGVSACLAVGGSGDGRRRRNLRHVHS